VSIRTYSDSKLLFAEAFSFLWRCGRTRAMASSFLRFIDHTHWRITVGSTSLDEWSARPRDLYLTTHNTQHRQTSIHPAGFEPTIPASERPQTYALDRVAIGICSQKHYKELIYRRTPISTISVTRGSPRPEKKYGKLKK